MIALKHKTYPSLIISEEKIQILLLDKTGKRASRLAEERLEPSVITGGEVKNGEKLSQSLLRLFQAAKIDKREVVVGIPENKCYTKILSMPLLRIDELTEAVEWEAETYLPVPADQVYMDWKIISEEKNHINILLIAVAKEIIDGYTAALEAAHLTPVAFETTALSLVRLIEKEGKRAVILELQREHAVLTLTKGKLIEASSIVSLAGEEGEAGLPYLIQTIQKMLAFYETKHQDEEKVQTIYVCGEGASQEAIDEIGKGSGREVKPCPLPIENLPKGRIKLCAVASSLAQKEIEEPKNVRTINLLPPKLQEAFDVKQNQWINKYLFAIATGVTATVAIAALGTQVFLGGVAAKLESEKLTLAPLPQETGEAIKETERLNRNGRTIVEVGSGRTFPQTRLAVLLPNIPEGVAVVSLTLDENQKKLKLVGKARTRTVLLKFRENIEGTDMFSEATLPLSSIEQAENIDFIMNIKMN